MHKPSIWVVLQVVVLGVILVFVALYLRAQWLSLDRPLTGQNLLGLGGAALVTGLGMLLLPLGAWVMQRWFGQRVGWLGMWRAFFLAQLAKYLPGGFWSIPGRAILYHRQGIPALESGTLVALEMVGLLAGAGVVGLLGVPVFLPQIVPHWGVAVPVTLGGIALAVLMLALARRRWARLGEALRRIPALALAQVCLTYALNWVVLGVAFALIPLALGHPFDAASFVQFIGIHAVAWAVGFVVIFAPGGIGVREAVLVFGLGTFMPVPLAIVTSVLARLLWTLAEVMGFAALTLYEKISRKEARNETPQAHHPDTLL